MIQSLATLCRILQNKKRKENPSTMGGNKNKINLQSRKQRQDTGETKKDISDEHSM